MNKEERETREYRSLFADERYAKKAWKQFFSESLESAGKMLPQTIDPKTRDISFQSLLDQQAYNNVKARLEAQGLTREPMQAELIVECGILRSRFDNNMFNTVLERTAGKVKEELTVNANAYEDLTDEELEVLAAFKDLTDKELEALVAFRAKNKETEDKAD